MTAIRKLKPDIKSEVTKFLRLLLAANFGVEKVILFGSQAKNTANRWSDIDLAVVPKNPNLRTTKLMDIARQASDRMEVIPVSKERLNSKYDTLAGEIRKDGQIIFASDRL